jgi:lipoprotein-anchoring transpeptidase ErfK/SrfK
VFPYGPDFRGGASVATADIDGDGKDEIVTSPGPTGGPHIKIWRADGGEFGGGFFAFDADKTGGTVVAAGDLNGDGKDEIVAALSGKSQPVVRVFDPLTFGKVGEFEAIGNGFDGGLNVAVADVNGDKANDVIAVPNGGGGPHVHLYDGKGSLLGAFFALPEQYRGGVLLDAGTFSADGTLAVTMPAERTVFGRPHLPQWIHVSVKEQRLRAFEYGRLTKTFLISTARAGFTTPRGDHSIMAKPFHVRYAGYYGPNNPLNYDLGIVPYNLRFAPRIYIHYAPWHNNFGAPMSRGCVNVNRTNAEWIYDWADLGTTVTVE